MTTAQEIIDDAMIEIGVLVAGSSLSDADLTWSTRKLNRFLGTLPLDGFNLFAKVTENFPLVSGTAVYTIGDGADFDTVRPIAIHQAFIREGDYDYPVGTHPIDQYWGITTKETQGRPINLFYDPQTPNGNIYLHYVPDSTYDLWIVSIKPFTAYSDVDDDVDFPPEFENMIVSNFALQLCPRYGKSPTRELKETAMNSMANIRANNLARSMNGKAININSHGTAYNVDAG